MDCHTFLKSCANTCEQLLDAALPAVNEAPERLHQAMRHATLGGGKRLRPALVQAACIACGGTATAAEPAMAAIELLHTYTLVHDDLPAMDDDDLRRGQPTVHIAFDEATAILVGDALQCLAFEQLSQVSSAAVLCLAQAAGSRGVIGGQQDDLDAEHQRSQEGNPAALLERIHQRKTAALIAAACELGGHCAQAQPQQLAALRAFGMAIGLGFQLIDDLLDVTADASTLGKTPGKDAANGKLTSISLNGLEATRLRADHLAQEARAHLSLFGTQGSLLQGLSTMLIERAH